MSSRMVPKLVLLIVPALLAASPGEGSPTPGPSGDLAKLQGAWTVKAGPKRDIPVTLAIKGTEVSVDLASPLGIKVHAEGKLKINESANPKTIDWVGFSIVDGQDFPDVLGIYELSEATFKMVTGGSNDRRPSEFKKGDGALADVLVFTRAK
jgi:uncharacterized protein (TIGR03067 family)